MNTTTQTSKSIVVGFDGSPAGHHAVRWGLAEGRLRGVPVQVVHVVEVPVTHSPDDEPWLSQGQRTEAQTEMRKALPESLGSEAAIRVVEGSIVGTLCNLSHNADLVVVGARGTGGFSGLLVGSVGLSVAVHAACPVVVARGPQRADVDDLPIVVGLDESDPARAALGFAFAEAVLHRSMLVVLQAWKPPQGERDPDELETAQQHRIHEMVQEYRTAFPSVPLSTRLVAEGPGKALVEASREAQLVVVGSRGLGGFKGLLLGSVGQQLLHHSECPVAIVR